MRSIQSHRVDIGEDIQRSPHELHPVVTTAQTFIEGPLCRSRDGRWKAALEDFPRDVDLDIGLVPRHLAQISEQYLIFFRLHLDRPVTCHGPT